MILLWEIALTTSRTLTFHSEQSLDLKTKILHESLSTILIPFTLLLLQINLIDQIHFGFDHFISIDYKGGFTHLITRNKAMPLSTDSSQVQPTIQSTWLDLGYPTDQAV